MKSLLVPVVSLLILIFFFVSVSLRKRRRYFGLFLYFIAGIVSLSAELISFYLYQSLAGSLYSEIAVLIAVFMLGLALGTYYSCRINKENLEYPALLLLLTAMVVFFATYDIISTGVLLFYHVCFLFTTALATGSLFVAATDRFYYGRAGANRGIGYSLELIGSSMGALLATTVLLPIMGLQLLLISIIILTAMALVGAIATV
jgi:spermidine synthase